MLLYHVEEAQKLPRCYRGREDRSSEVASPSPRGNAFDSALHSDRFRYGVSP